MSQARQMMRVTLAGIAKSSSRADLLAGFNIQDEGLRNLIEDLCAKPEDANNLAILRKALRGCYSDFGSNTDSVNQTITADFIAAGYLDLAPKIINTGRYEHDYAPELIQNDSKDKRIYSDREQQMDMFSATLRKIDPNKTMGEIFGNDAATSELTKLKL